MAVSKKDLFFALLSLDSYNRGGRENGAGIDLTSTKIGGATIKSTPMSEGFDEAGFYAAEYDTDYGTVISYRGTDFDPITNLRTDAW
ncbi:MAG: hypothetical protein L3J32_09435 [Rhizobiaceae bacterium]|nr:hypothetical protein [Rhizobiaceae bacterium]